MLKTVTIKIKIVCEDIVESLDEHEIQPIDGVEIVETQEYIATCIVLRSAEITELIEEKSIDLLEYEIKPHLFKVVCKYNGILIGKLPSGEWMVLSDGSIFNSLSEAIDHIDQMDLSAPR